MLLVMGGQTGMKGYRWWGSFGRDVVRIAAVQLLEGGVDDQWEPIQLSGLQEREQEKLNGLGNRCNMLLPGQR